MKYATLGYSIDPSIIDQCNSSNVNTPEEVYELFEEYRESEAITEEDAWDLACASV